VIPLKRKVESHAGIGAVKQLLPQLFQAAVIDTETAVSAGLEK